MLLKRNNKGLKVRSQPKLERSTTKTVRLGVGSGTSTANTTHHKQSSTLSCLPIDKPSRNHRQRKSLEDLTNLNRQHHIGRIHHQLEEGWVEQFTFEMEIGQGAFGSVWKVRDQKGRARALKVMHKEKIIAQNSRDMVLNERNILTRIGQSSFIVNCLEASQDAQHLYLLMQYMSGGDLRYLMYRFRKRFSQGQTKFLACCLLIALEYLHDHGIVHRDIKPENLVLDQKGYLRITDMGISRSLHVKCEHDSSGTPAYMAPEVLQNSPSTQAGDFYALGVVTYELLNGRRPYQAKSRAGIIQQLRCSKEFEFSPDITPEAISFCRSLLQKDPRNRLGYRSIQQLFAHKWLAGIDWQCFRRKKYNSPFQNDEPSLASLQQYNRRLELSPQNRRHPYSALQSESMFQGYNYRKER